MSHYEHIAPDVIGFFAGKGIAVQIEPHGSRGLDIEGTGPSGRMVGEIKHATELARDLKSTFWSAWNSPAQSFGGKAKGYVLSVDLPPDAGQQEGELRGWLAVVFGQLRTWARKADLSEGWLVYEDADQFEPSLRQTLAYLAHHGLAKSGTMERVGNMGFVRVTFGV